MTDADLQFFVVREEISTYKTSEGSRIMKRKGDVIRSVKTSAARATRETQQLVEFLQQLDIRVLSAHLKIESQSSAEVLVTVSDSDYVKRSFMDVYGRVNAMRSSVSGKRANVNFKFVNRGDLFDLEAVHADGFTVPFSLAATN